MAWLKTLLKINWIDSWLSVNWSKVNCILKSQTLTFWSKSSVKDYNLSKHVKMWNFVHQEIKKSRFHFEKSKFLNLEIFLSVGNFMFFHNFEQNFPHDARWFNRNFQHESFISPWNIQLLFTQLLLKVLVSQVIILWIHAHELKITAKFCPS